MSDGAVSNPSLQSEAVASQMASHMERVAAMRDRAAFTQLFDFYAPRVKAYLVRSNCEPAIAEEITQDVMTTLWNKAALFDRNKSSVGTWLFRIARNRRIDLIRRDKSDRLDPDDPTLFPSVSEIDLDTMDALERDRRVRLAINGLPEEQKLLVHLSFFEGYPHSRIAQDLGLPLGTVKSRIRLAFNRLRKQLEEDDKVDIG